MCSFVKMNLYLWCNTHWNHLSSVVTSFLTSFGCVIDTSFTLHKFQEQNFRIEFWKSWILLVAPPTHSGMLWLPGAAFLSSLSFFFHATCLHSPAVFNFTLCNFLHLSGFLSKEERGPKNGRTIKALDFGVAAEMWRGLSCSQPCAIRPAALCSAAAQRCIYSWGLPLQLWAQAWSFP